MNKYGFWKAGTAVLLAAACTAALSACGKSGSTAATASSGDTADAQTTTGTSSADMTAKGYSIEVKDGVTYIDGTLIVNKTYSLPESYAPGGLYDYVQTAFDQMQADAAAQGLKLWVQSGYRSYSRQVTLYNQYVQQDGKAAADTYSSRPGHSEHQSGLCFDLNTVEESFADTAEGKWVRDNCWKYGFIIRFPEGKDAYTGYEYEPWHLRYLGTDLAKKVYDSGLSLEEYYGITSVYTDD